MIAAQKITDFYYLIYRCCPTYFVMILRKFIQCWILIYPSSHFPIFVYKTAIRRYKESFHLQKDRLVATEQSLHHIQTFLQWQAFLKCIESSYERLECHDLFFICELSLFVEFWNGANIDIVEVFKLFLEKIL